MSVRLITGDCRERLRELEAQSVHACVTSPPYYALRSYLPDDHPHKHLEIGLEETPTEFVECLVELFRDVRRVLRDDGTLWLNLGDSYAGSWGAQSRGGSPSERSTLKGNGHTGGGPKLKSLSAVQIAAAPKKASHTGTIRQAGLKPKDLIGVPWEVAFALRADGWWLRSAIIWAKPNVMPGSQEDRCTSSYEMVFMLSKSATYWSDFDAIKTPPRESSLVRTAQDVQAQAGSHRATVGAKTNGPMKAVGGLTGRPHGRHSLGDAIPPKERRTNKQAGHGNRNYTGFNDRWDAAEVDGPRPAMMRDVWFVPPAQYSAAHYAVMPDEIARRCILAGCPEGGTVLDPFGGAGTTGLVADRLGRSAVLIELDDANVTLARTRIEGDAGMFADVEAA